ncbi:MAG: inosine/xanthosine triphosphatase [Euryarchaeota archaeon]|nr:inosine/xanthosine triphosphatase [Euryarchaeota archaeon]MBU4608790.1 inosine/xanthosine triphosphatase [Euryarchaeota archaeon]MBV1729881.1 inosine/xanthosine triphosphatase [Methanobacterium sp.]MBV1753988.1 inosine/xanthosine triphosphatase [Methanobacterium sp.]
MKAIVGSKNPVKAQAVENILKKIYPEQEVEVLSREVDSGVPDQPLGQDETIQGAINRARKAYSDEFNLSVGIESGLMPVKETITGYVDMQWCAIYDGEKITLGVSAGFEYPPHVVEEVLKGREVGHIMDELTGVDNLGKKRGAVSYLTDGLLDRVGNSEQCVLMAMVPWMNAKTFY